VHSQVIPLLKHSSNILYDVAQHFEAYFVRIFRAPYRDVRTEKKNRPGNQGGDVIIGTLLGEYA
jgi:hypothetical protein